jgi:hypothetical protein
MLCLLPDLLPLDFPTLDLIKLSSAHAQHTPLTLILLDVFILILGKEYRVKLSARSYDFIPLGPNILLRTLFWSTFSLPLLFTR